MESWISSTHFSIHFKFIRHLCRLVERNSSVQASRHPVFSVCSTLNTIIFRVYRYDSNISAATCTCR